MEKIRLGELTKIKTGKLDANASSSDGQYPFFTCSREPLKISSYSYDCECVLVAGNGDLNVKYYKGKFDAYQRTYIIEDNSDGRLFIPYLYYFMEEYIDELRNQSIGGVIKYIKLGNLTEAKLQLPTIEKQKEIVNILVKNKSILDKRKLQLSELDNLIKSRFVEMFGDKGKEVPLTDYVWFQEGPGVRSVSFKNEGCILLTGSNINDNNITFGYKSDRFISDDLANGAYSHFICDKNDILVVSSAIAPDNFDKKVVVIESEDKYCLNTGIIRFKPNSDHLTVGYFREFLKSMFFKRQVMSEMRGIAQMHFGPSHLSKMNILLPSNLQSQMEFEIFINQVDKLKSSVQKSLDTTQALFDSLMQEYFG